MVNYACGFNQSEPEEYFEQITKLITHMEKLLDSDWLRAVQFKCNASAKSATPVTKILYGNSECEKSGFKKHPPAVFPRLYY